MFLTNYQKKKKMLEDEGKAYFTAQIQDVFLKF